MFDYLNLIKFFMEKQGFKNVVVIKDYEGIDRMVIGVKEWN